MSKLIQIDPYSLPPTFSDDEVVVAKLRMLFVAAETKRARRLRMFWCYAFIFVALTASFIVRHYR